jgi:hypothetical protein
MASTMGAAIVSGLKGQDQDKDKPASGTSTTLRARTDRAAIRLAALLGAMRAWTDNKIIRLAASAAARSITSGSLAGISLLLGLCSAAWFSGGARDAERGAIAVGIWWVAALSARRMAVLPRDPARRAVREHADWWPVAVCAIASETAIYGGIAAGGPSGRGHTLWPLAIVALSSVGVTEMISACRRPAPGDRPAAASSDGAEPSGWPRAGALVWGRLDKLAAPSAPARVLLAVAVLLSAGPRSALLAVLAAEVASACVVVFALASQAGVKRGGRFARPAEQGRLRVYRDDGPIARWTGLLVRGNLIPLPPVLAGVIATALLAGLGLRGLPGFIVLTPPVVMLLAAPGSSHPHDRRLDWLVPPLLVLAQLIYLGAFGLAEAVPGPVVFAACAITVVWYAGLTASTERNVASGIGWEARMFIPGLGAIFGLATFGYVGLAAYVGALICRKGVISYSLPGEEDRR